MLKLEYKSYSLKFSFDAGTSRGVMTERPVWFLKLTDDADLVTGVGEVAPLFGLSQEKPEDVEHSLHSIQQKLKAETLPKDESQLSRWLDELLDYEIASTRFGLEMAALDLIRGGRQLWFLNKFTLGKAHIPINGLIWMGNRDIMKSRIVEKLENGFHCIKLKIGAIDFDEELALVRFIRSISDDVIIRLDANGAMQPNKALRMLQKLSEFRIHSIEQPILPGQAEAMSLLCDKSPIPIALDEELIGLRSQHEKMNVLEELEPAFIILKPSLLGGFSRADEWISLASKMGIGWWVTSALESNIGLNAISQYTGQFDGLSHQGLGTGQLFDNNFNSPLDLRNDQLFYLPDRPVHTPFEPI